MQQTFEKFSELIDRRLSAKIYTTEDSVRYTFFSALTVKSIVPESIVLEYPHPHIAGAEIDTWIFQSGGLPIAMEFKYDRKIPSEGNSPRTHKAGKLFNDLFRLSHLHDNRAAECYFIYLTDNEMSDYMMNPQNKVIEFFDLKPNAIFQIDQAFISDKSSTFRKAAGQYPTSVKIKCAYRSDYADLHCLRIYQIV